jgi:uncharacterized protein DUF5666
LVGLAALTTACGNHSASPTSPSTQSAAAPSPASPVATSGATVSGTVVGISGASQVRTLGVGLTVSVSGSSISTSVDSSGHFMLAHVPAGHVELHFVGTGVDARLGLDNVAEHQTITIAVKVSGSTAELDNNEREDQNNNAEVEGAVTATSANTLTVAGKMITVDAKTVIVRGNTPVALSTIKAGTRVEVQGTVTGATTITATRIQVEDENEVENDVEVEGVVTSTSANTITVNGKMITVAASTVIVHGATAMSLAGIHVNDRVHVTGTATSPTIVAATRIEVQNGAETPGDEDEAETEIDGTVTALGASSLTVNSRVISVTPTTQIVQDGRSLTLSAIHMNDRVQVKAMMSGTTLVATRIELKSSNSGPGNDGDNRGGEVELSGTVSGRSTGCPVTFSVSGTSVSTDGKTEFKDTSCSALANGDRVEVKGTKQSAGVLATRVERKK